MENIEYVTAEIERYFSRNRVKWNQFYESERVVIEAIWPAEAPRILDIGCGCAGLGLALRERFGASRYTGVEINREAAASAAKICPMGDIRTGDFLNMSCDELAPESFDVVFSLSCIDWNIRFDDMLQKAWSMVKPGGRLVLSLRLTALQGVDDIATSYQYINYEGRCDGEVAAYVVLNAADLADRLRSLGIGSIFGYGYYGKPSVTAVTPFEQLCFAVLAMKKPPHPSALEIDLRLPAEIASSMTRRLQRAD